MCDDIDRISETYDPRYDRKKMSLLTSGCRPVINMNILVPLHFYDSCSGENAKSSLFMEPRQSGFLVVVFDDSQGYYMIIIL